MTVFKTFSWVNPFEKIVLGCNIWCDVTSPFSFAFSLDILFCSFYLEIF